MADGSWEETSSLKENIILEKEWLELLERFSNKFPNLKVSNKFIFTLYVLNYIKYKITNLKTLMKLKLIISKAESYITNISPLIIYTTDLRNLFNLI